MHVTFKRVASILVSFVLVSLASAQNRRHPTGTLIAEYTVPTPNSGPMGIVTGPDGNIWFTEYDGNKIGRITPGGVITEFPVPTADSLPPGIAAGPDGAIWFTEASGNKIGRVTTNGRLRDRFLPHAASGPWGLAFAADGSLWITEFAANAIERMTPDIMFQRFPITSHRRAFPIQIIVGPDGRMWFTEYGGSHIGVVDASGKIVERYVGGHGATGLTNGPDGRVWVCLSYYLDSKIAAVDTRLNVTVYPLPNPASAPTAITVGPDGNLWITEAEDGAPAILQMSSTGQVLGEFPLPDFYSDPEGITVGPDGNIWFTEFGGNRIGVMAP
jgi:streptogramin lyase